ncbi:MAG: hypothetical protein LBL64_07910 [Treponema sp.]|jgi:hypothetical protein|nr:hypothetical protein [Treponema sp.]
MMKQEFEKRIGLVITAREYTEIEAAYMGLPDSVDKHKFVKIWLQNGGIQDLFDKRQVAINSLAGQVLNKEKEVMSRVHDFNNIANERNELKNRVEELEKKLAAIGNLAAGSAA